ncbi:MAG: hypothetical protein WCJ29_03270 [bacterium]
MKFQHWVPPRVAVVLLHNGVLRLARDVTRGSYFFPEGEPESKDGDVFKAAKRIMREQFKVEIATDGLVSANIAGAYDDRGQVVIYVLAHVTTDGTDPLPGLSLREVKRFRLRELANEGQLAPDIQPIYEAAQAMHN